MRDPAVLSRIPDRIASAVALITVALTAASCGGSAATSMTAPTSINRCGISMQGIDAPVPAEGGTASITVSASRECAWSASAEGSWLTIRTGANGQGDGVVEFSATANPDPQMRRGAITANGQRAEISQSAGTCDLVLGQSAASFNQGGGTGQVQVRASSPMCGWSASSDADWIQIRTTSGQGNGTVSFEVPTSTAPPRSATITIAGQKFSVTQSEGCAYTIAPPVQSIAAAGGNGAIAITTTPTCPWTAASNVAWLTVSPASGSGSASVTFAATATAGRSRTGTAVIAGQPFVVTQSQGCSYVVRPSSGQVAAAGGTLPISVSANAECEWSAVSNDGWISLQGRSSGSGDGTVTVVVASTTGPARSGTVTIAGQPVAVTQSPGCAFSISPETATAPSAASTGKVAVTSGTGCAWTATSNAPWLTISSGSSGTGNGEIQYAAAATTGPARSGTLTIGGHTFTLNQGEGCTFTLSSSSAAIDDEGGQGSFTVRTGTGCGWTATSTMGWLTISSGATGTGEGVVRFTVARNTGPSRSAAITVGGQTFTVTQGTGCAITLATATFDAAAGGATGSVNLTAGPGCGWTATSNVNWLSVTSGANGTGNGTVGFTVVANTGPVRQGTLTIGGRTFTVSQAENCSSAISPDRVSVPAAAGFTNVSVTAPAGCGWTASASAPWLAVNSGNSGTGNGSVRLAIQENTGAPRSGTATIAGQVFTVNQGSGCSYGLSSSSQNVGAAGGSVTVAVNASAGCAWTASSQAPWLTISAGGSGAGSSPVQIDVQANTGGPRSGAVVIAGQAFTVLQDTGCSFVVSPEAVRAPAAGGGARVEVAAAASCAWTAVSHAGWIGVTGSAGGSGNGTFDLSVATNPGPARSGTVTVAARTVTVMQESGCTFSLSATSVTMPGSGGVGTVSVSTAGGCPWSAVSGAAWITITDGASGSGSGNVQFAVEPNGTGAPRSGTLTIANLAFAINQQ